MVRVSPRSLKAEEGICGHNAGWVSGEGIKTDGLPKTDIDPMNCANLWLKMKKNIEFLE